MHATEHESLLQRQLDILNDIYKNTLAQSDAIEKKDYDLLGRLLKKREGYLAALSEAGDSPVPDGGSRDVPSALKTEQLESSLRELKGEILGICAANIQKAEKHKGEIGDAIRRLRLNKNAVENGYFRRSQPMYGCFVDKKIGGR